METSRNPDLTLILSIMADEVQSDLVIKQGLIIDKYEENRVLWEFGSKSFSNF